MLENQIVVLQMPLQGETAEYGATKRLLQRLVLVLYKGWLFEQLGRPHEPDDAYLMQERELDERRVPTLMMFLDVPLGCGVRGGAILPAQARAVGCAVVHIGPASSVEITKKDDETKAWLANMNTKIVYGTGGGLQLIAPNDPWTVETNQQRAVVMCGLQTMAFTPYTD